MTRALSVVVALGISLVVRRAGACDQWTGTLDLRSTAIRAGLVVVAHRSDSTISLVADDRPWEAFAIYEIEQVLKGSPPARSISIAKGWLHDVGIDVEPGRSVVLFLERHGDRYYPVRDGCARDPLPVSDGKAVLADITLPFDVLSRELGFTWAAPPPRDTPERSWPTPVPLAVVLGVACAGAGFALGNHVGRRH